MELMFNEISITPLLVDRHQANERMQLFSEAVAEARKKGFRNIRSHLSSSEIRLTESYSLNDWLFDKEFSMESRSLFHGMFVQPFLDEDDEEVEARYVEANYFFQDNENQIPKQICLGLTSAYLSENLAISFQSGDSWRKNALNIIIETDSDTSIDEVHHVFSKGCFSKEFIANFVESISTLQLLETDLAPSDKHIHLTSHHGQQELNDLWNRIKNSPYVISGLSIEWGGNSFCKNPRKDGKLDIVHLKSDRKYALQIQTTGRNLSETVEIAKRLTEAYG